jgi:hypothetical protein
MVSIDMTFGLYPGGTRGDFLTKNKSSRLALEGTGTDAVFCADCESAFRSIEIVIHLKETTTKSSKKGKKSSIFKKEHRISRVADVRKPWDWLGFVAFFKRFPMMFEL